MKITYFGTGAAEGIPALFCNCDYCRSVRKIGGRSIRSRSQVIVDGDLAIDFPPDCFYHAAVMGADFSAIRYLLVTHSHMDHFYAHDFILRGYKYASAMVSGTLDIFGNEEVKCVFEECTRRELRPEIGDTVFLHTLAPFEESTFGAWRINTLKAQHTSTDPILYLIEKGNKRILHLTDTGRLPEENYSYLAAVCEKPVDLITFDCTFLWEETKPNARHMGLDENLRTFARLKELGLATDRTKRVITHFSHNSRPTEESLKRAEEKLGVIAAYDGMEILI